ncbi:unnamed protein product [Merluccius merluccius]
MLCVQACYLADLARVPVIKVLWLSGVNSYTASRPATPACPAVSVSPRLSARRCAHPLSNQHGQKFMPCRRGFAEICGDLSDPEASGPVTCQPGSRGPRLDGACLVGCSPHRPSALV